MSRAATLVRAINDASRLPTGVGERLRRKKGTVSSPQAPPKETFVYFVRAGEYVKIGQSLAWRRRIASMQTGSPHEIAPLLVLKATPYMERSLHKYFRSYHFRGEWFYCTKVVLDFIESRKADCVAKSETDDLRRSPESVEDAADDL